MLMIFPADISPLSFSPVGEMQITLRSVKDLEMQITLRSVKDLEMQITLVLSKTWRCRLLYVVDNLLIIRWLQAIARPPEYLSLPYGEARWGLKR